MTQVQERVSLKFIVVGGSIAGLSTAYALKKAGHDVSLVEASDGKSAMMTAVLAVPTATKILQQWGLTHLLNNIAEAADCLQYLDSETGHELMSMTTVLFEPLKTDAAAEFISLPGKELRVALYELAKKEGVTFRFNTQVVDVDPASGIVTLADGEQLAADLIVAADGFYSFIRKYVVENEDDKAEESNGRKKTLLVSVSLSLEKILVDETLRSLSNPALWTFWLGDGLIGQGSVVERERIYSLTLEFVYHGDIAPEDKHWREIGQSELRLFGIDFENLEERLRKLIRSSNQMSIKIFANKRLTDSVVCARSRCILVGDAAHSLTPGNLHASGLDFEDAQILGCLFSRIQDRSQIGRFTTAYDEIRQPRSSSLFEFIEKRRAAFMAPKGPLRDLRNSILKQYSELRDHSETETEGLNEGMSLATQHANDMVEDWWSKYGTSLVTVPERRYSVLSNVEISVAKKTQGPFDVNLER